MQATHIQWTDFTSNPIKYRDDKGKSVWACEKNSPGCAHCYAEALAKRYGRGGPFTKEATAKVDTYLDEKELRALAVSPKIAGKKTFVGDMTDIAGEWVLEQKFRDLFGVLYGRPDATFQILTKRAERLPELLFGFFSPVPHIHIGFTAEDQRRFDQRWPHMKHLADAGWLVWCSAEPMIGPIDMSLALAEGLGWVVVGGESGPGARPFNVGWAEDIVAQCKVVSAPCFVKQMGSNPFVDRSPEPAASLARKHGIGPLVAEFIRLKHRAGGDPEEWPNDLRVREFPKAGALVQ